MKTIALVSCVSKKKDYPTKAEDLYESTLFVYALKYAKMQNPDCIYILSALHGLVELNQILEPYNIALNNMKTADRKIWSNKVLHQMQEKNIDLCNDHIIILAGDKYRKFLLPYMKNYSIPMLGLPIGKQLQYLKNNVNKNGY